MLTVWLIGALFAAVIDAVAVVSLYDDRLNPDRTRRDVALAVLAVPAWPIVVLAALVWLLAQLPRAARYVGAGLRDVWWDVDDSVRGWWNDRCLARRPAKLPSMVWRTAPDQRTHCSHAALPQLPQINCRCHVTPDHSNGYVRIDLAAPDERAE